MIKLSEGRGRLAGHALQHGGMTAGGKGPGRNGSGPGQCQCGISSYNLPNTTARKEWHLAHKADIRRGGTGSRLHSVDYIYDI